MTRPEYLHHYDDPRITEAYRLYVDGKLLLKSAAELTDISKRTLERWSARDGWKSERASRQKLMADVSVVAAVSPNAATVEPPLPDGASLETKLLQALTSTDTQTRFSAVLLTQRAFFDELMSDARELLSRSKEAARSRNAALPIGQLLVITGIGEKIATQQRKAHGIPDLSKLEVARTPGICPSCSDIRRMSDEELNQELDRVQGLQRAALKRQNSRTPTRAEEQSN